jgi:hypothetical protein
VGEFAVDGGVDPACLQTEIVIGREVVCDRAFTGVDPTGCAVCVMGALMFTQEGTPTGEGVAQVVGEHVGV